MKKRLTSLYGHCAEEDCVHRDCGGHISEGSVAHTDIRRLWAPLLMMQMCSFVWVHDCGRLILKAISVSLVAAAGP